MNKIPLFLRLKKESHRKIALAQDLILSEVYKTFSRPVFHGGTAIWRCYGGRRFSEDLDFYLPHQKEKINQLFRELEKKGFIILKKKISPTSVYSELEQERVRVRLEGTYQKVEGHLIDYENVDGNFTVIYSLTPEEFILEKIKAYLKRFKIRDLYDIFFLSKYVAHPELIKKEIKKLLEDYKKPPDEGDLKTLLLEGVIPSSEEMKEYLIRKWDVENI